MTTPLPHQILFSDGDAERKQGHLFRGRSVSYAVSLGVHLTGLTILLAAPFINSNATDPRQVVVASRPKHVILYYQPARPLPAPRTVAEARVLPPIVHPKPVLAPQPVPKPKVFTPPPAIVAKAVPEPAPDIPKAPVLSTRMPDSPQTAALPRIPEVKPIKMGTFGDPNGAAPSERSPAPALVAKLGGFDAAVGSSSMRSNGNGRAGPLRTGFFGDGSIAGGPSSGSGGSGSVKAGGFGDGSAPVAGAPRVRPVSQEAATPLQILSKPKPIYTEEARQKRVEGVVDLEVVFRANGEIQVLRVVRGLGYGLDQAAVQVAGQIRFRPGTRDGVAVDSRTIVHVTFELT